MWAWGRNNFGQLGNGGKINALTPVQVSGLTGVAAIAGGGFHTIAMTNDGTVWAWGANESGQLGDGTTTYKTAPVQVIGLMGVSAVAGGGSHTIALKNDGTVWAWGANGNGQLGDGTTTNRVPAILRTIEIILYKAEELFVCNGCLPPKYDNIQSAIDAAFNYDVVIVEDGNYVGNNIKFRGKAITVRSANGPQRTSISVTWGEKGFIFDSAETTRSVLQGVRFIFSLWDTEKTTTGVYINSWSSASIVDSIFSGTADTITFGRGILLEGSNAYIANSVFDSINQDDNEGGTGIKITGFNNTVYNSSFKNLIGNKGAAIFVGEGIVPWANRIYNCTFSNNKASGNPKLGGGVYVDINTALTSIRNSVFAGNISDYGGGIYNSGVYTEITNCIFYGNNSNQRGGAIYDMRVSNPPLSDPNLIQLYKNSPTYITNCTITDNTATLGGGVYSDNCATTLTNSILYYNSSGQFNYLYSSNETKPKIQNCDIQDYSADADGNFGKDPLFVLRPSSGFSKGSDLVWGTADDGDLRLQPKSPCIDAGQDITWLFSDIRGSYRPIDGDNKNGEAFDIGAYEYSRYYGGIGGDSPAKAFQDLKINGTEVKLNSTEVVTGLDMEISWKDRPPFPLNDDRIQQAGKYEVRLSLVDEESGRRIDLRTQWVTVSPSGYTVTFKFGLDHIGTWQLRLELVSDPNQFILSDQDGNGEPDNITIRYTKVDTYNVGEEIQPPPGVYLKDMKPQKPDISNEEAVYWSTKSNKLYAIAPRPIYITWYKDEQRTVPIPVNAYLKYPPSPQKYILDTQPVELLPAGTPFDSVQLMYAAGDANTNSNTFRASQEGWAVLLYQDEHATNDTDKEQFEVVKILKWNSPEVFTNNVSNVPVDIGTEIKDNAHNSACGGGYVLFEKAFYDGYGDSKAYDRAARKGPIYAVNKDLTGINPLDLNPKDDLVVVWYNKSKTWKTGTAGVCWPYQPVRYGPQWPADPQKLGTIVIASERGTGPLNPVSYGPVESMQIYNQPDKNFPGFNPNEEHASFFTAKGSEYQAIFPLRTDLNKVDTSEPYVLFKYKSPLDDVWRFKVYKVIDQSKTYEYVSGGITEMVNNLLGSLPLYYLDANGTLTVRSGALPASSYYINAEGMLVNPADAVMTCYNFNTSTGKIESVSSCSPEPGVVVKKYSLNDSGQLTEGTNTGYTLNKNGELSSANDPYKKYKLISGQIREVKFARYYLDFKGVRQPWEGALFSPSYYLDAGGRLVSPADAAKTCYNLSGSIASVPCEPDTGVKKYYLNESGIVSEQPVPTGQASYALNEYGVLSNATDPSKKYKLISGQITEVSLDQFTLYYLDAKGILKERSAYYLTAEGRLANLADDVETCYNLNTSAGIIESVECDPETGVKIYYLNNSGQLTEGTNTGYALDKHGVLVDNNIYYRFHYFGVAGNEINPFYPMNQMAFGPCPESDTDTKYWVLKDKDNKFFSRNGSYAGTPFVDVVLKYYYRMQPSFFLDKNGDGIQDVTAGTCMTWQDKNTGIPQKVAFEIGWPELVPTLYVGETLTDSKTQKGEGIGLPNIKDQCIVDVLFDQPVEESNRDFTYSSVKLLDPMKEYAAPLSGLNDWKTQLPRLEPKMDLTTGRWHFAALPKYLQDRITFDPTSIDNKTGKAGQLKLKGIYSSGIGEPLLLLNSLTTRDINLIESLLEGTPSSDENSFLSALKEQIEFIGLKKQGDDGLTTPTSYQSLKDAEMKALSAGNAWGTGYVTVAVNNHKDCAAPTMLYVIRVGCPLYVGEIKVLEPDNPFEEKVTLRHNGDFGGDADKRWFQWVYRIADFSGIPEGPQKEDEAILWKNYSTIVPNPLILNPLTISNVNDILTDDNANFYKGAVDTTIQGTGQQLLPDKWFAVRYFYGNESFPNNVPPKPDNICSSKTVSGWTSPQLYEGWIKRVMKKINLFDQKVKDFHTAEPETLAGMISLTGRRYEGPVPLNDDPEVLQNLGILEVYETLLDRGMDLADGTSDINKTLLFAANRIAGLYTLLGNEAYADAMDPTIGFSTENGVYGTEAASIFAFENQVDSLLEEEQSLLRGMDREGVRPYYNRLVWNFTLGDGEVAYKENYNITDQDTDQNGDGKPDGPDGQVNEYDAKVQYPQGHGDAWGHYLSAVKKYYELLKFNKFSWIPQTEAILVGGMPVEVDYRDERQFAKAAAAKARTGSEIVNLTYRQYYTEDPKGQWQGYKDTKIDNEYGPRAWGVDEWSRRAGMGAFFDWVTGNALLPAVPSKDDMRPLNKPEDIPQNLKFTLKFEYKPGLENLKVYVKKTGEPYKMKTVGSDYIETASDKVTFTSSVGLQIGDEVLFRVSDESIQGMQRVDRNTVLELGEISDNYQVIEAEVDKGNLGLNPLGLAKDVLPMDIDPVRVANGETHFEQIYGRAVQAMNNAIAVFNHANQSTQLLRRQQDTLADFKRNIDNSETDFTNRLIEVYGYPYPDDCGPGKTYSTAYCQEGPDLYHYMYTDPSELMGYEAPKTYDYTVTMKVYPEEPGRPLEATDKQVVFHIPTDSRFGLIKPSSWSGRRKAPGEVQNALSDLLQTRGRFERALQEYDNMIKQIESQAERIEMQYGLNKNEINIQNKAIEKQNNLNNLIKQAKDDEGKLRTIAYAVQWAADAMAEAQPKTVGAIGGTANGTVLDPFSTTRSALKIAGVLENKAINFGADEFAAKAQNHLNAKELTGMETNVELTTARGGFTVKQELLQLESLIRSKAPLELELYNLQESLRQSAGRLLGALAKGQRLFADRLRFRTQTAAQVIDYRYKDMTFRIFRNDALQKYRAQFDLAAMYVYLTAKAYDYETTLLDSNSKAGERFLTDIVKQRTIGMIQDGQPLTGSGLADPMKRMWQNFQVLKPQLGFNNPQRETNRFSLRTEMMRIRQDAGSNYTWKNALSKYRKDNLWDVPEYRKYCRPFGPSGVTEPGLVIPFDTTVTSGLNFFGWPLGGGDSYYSASNFATKVRAVGVWFSNYNSAGLAQTPRVYLVPVGEDVLRTPSYDVNEIRTFHVVDQKMPIPFPINTTEMENDPNWIPSVNTIFDEMFQIRRHSDFRAYHDSGYLNQSEMQYDSRLIGRSVWNSKWLLIIPGRNLLYDPDEGLDTFIEGPEAFGGYGERTGNGISDIKLFFETYSYSGN